MTRAAGTVLDPLEPGPEPGPAPSEALIREARRRQRRRWVAVAAAVVLALGVGAGVAVWGGGDGSTAKPTPAGDGAGVPSAARGARTQQKVAPPSQFGSTRPPWFDLRAMRKWCRNAPLAELARGGELMPDRHGGSTTTVNMPDRATGQVVRIPVRRYSAEAATVQPDPAGNLVGDFILVDGHVRGEYFRPVMATHEGIVGEFQTAGPPVDPATAQQEIAQQRARAVLICNRAKKLRMVSLPMCH